MELKTYLRIMIAKRWIVLATFFITFGAVLMLTLRQIPVYESVTAYVVTPALLDQDPRTLTAALDVLSRDQIESTVAQVATSNTIKSQAASALELSSNQMRGLSLSSRVLPRTDVVQIIVEGPDPTLARDYASTVGAQTATFVDNLNWAYELVMLDEATLASSPIRPKTTLNLLLGAIVGLVLGAGLAILSTYLQEPARGMVRDPEISVAKRADQVSRRIAEFEARMTELVANAKRADETLTTQREELLQRQRLESLAGVQSRDRA